jgi:hypothetical protein
MKKRFGAPSPALVVATVALFVALGGTSLAAVTALGKNTVGTAQLKKGSVTAAKIKNGAVTAAKINASASLRPVIYAHVAPDGTVDATESSGITAANIQPVGVSGYCFSGLPFTPKSGSVALDYGATPSGKTEQVQIHITTGTAYDCTSSDQHVEVVTAADATTFHQEGFYVILYG